MGKFLTLFDVFCNGIVVRRKACVVTVSYQNVPQSGLFKYIDKIAIIGLGGKRRAYSLAGVGVIGSGMLFIPEIAT